MEDFKVNIICRQCGWQATPSGYNIATLAIQLAFITGKLLEHINSAHYRGEPKDETESVEKH